MKLSVKAYVALGAVALVIPMFQNCAGNKFSDGTPAANESSTAAAGGGNNAASVPLPGGNPGNVTIPPATTGVPLQPTSPELANVCYDVTCISDAGGYKTIEGTTNSEGVVSVLAPSTGSAWVVAINSAHQVYSSLNCYPDNLTSPAPDFYSASLCAQNAPALAPQFPAQFFPGGVQFAQGKGRYLASCALNPCGYMKTDFYSGGSGFYAWVASQYSASAKSAVAKLRIKDYASQINGGTPFGVDATVPVGQCVTQTASLSTGNVTYQFCLGTNQNLQVVLPQHTFNLALSGLKPVM